MDKEVMQELERVYKDFIEFIKKKDILDKGKKTLWGTVFEFFFELAKKRGCKVRTNRKLQKRFNRECHDSWLEKHGTQPHEYLVDLCGWKGEDDRHWLDFIVEVEKKPDRPTKDLDEDFYKLLDMKAYMKIGVGACTKDGKKQLGRGDVEQLLDKVSQLLQNSPWIAKDERVAKYEGYLFIFIDNFSRDRAGISGHLLSGDGKIKKELTFYEYGHLRILGQNTD